MTATMENLHAKFNHELFAIPGRADYRLYTLSTRKQSSCVLASSETNRIGRETQQPESGNQPWPEFDAALLRSQNYLLSIQNPEGYWVGELMVDSTLVSDTVAYHHWNGKVDPEWQRKAVNHILSMQLPDGGWNIYHGGPSEVNATIKAYLALLGLVGWEHVPTIPCEVLLIGKWFHVNFWEMSNWSRAMLVPLAIINHFRPRRPLQGGFN